MNINIDYIIHKIRDYRKTCGFAKYRLAQMAGVPESGIRNMDSNEWNPTAVTLRKMENVIPADFIPSDPKKQPRKR